MSVSSCQESYEVYPKPTEEELASAREIVAEAKKRVKANPPKTAQEAWAKFETVRQKIIASLNNQSESSSQSK